MRLAGALAAAAAAGTVVAAEPAPPAARPGALAWHGLAPGLELSRVEALLDALPPATFGDDIAARLRRALRPQAAERDPAVAVVASAAVVSPGCEDAAGPSQRGYVPVRRDCLRLSFTFSPATPEDAVAALRGTFLLSNLLVQVEMPVAPVDCDALVARHARAWGLSGAAARGEVRTRYNVPLLELAARDGGTEALLACGRAGWTLNLGDDAVFDRGAAAAEEATAARRSLRGPVVAPLLGLQD